MMRPGPLAALAFAFRPRLLASLRGYTREDLRADLFAGVTVAMVALPLAMAFGIGSGVSPLQGLVTAIVGGFIVSLLGGSKVQIGGPAGAFVAILYTIAEKYGVANLLLSTMMAGVLLFAMGALKMGTLVRLIPVPIVIGFTSGIAVIIAISQFRDFLGINVAKMPSNFFSQMKVIADNIETANLYAIAMGLVSLLIIVMWPAPRDTPHSRLRRLTAKLPATIAVLFASSLVVHFADLPVETIGTRFGDLPRGMPMPHFPDFDWASAQNLFGATISIALLGAIESLLCARVADDLIHERHDPNQELMAQGIANFVSPLFGGISVTGTIARTVTNVKSGARSPVAGIVHAATLLLVILVAAPVAQHIPLSAMAAILLWVAFNMGNWREFPKLKRFSLFYRVTMLSTFALTVILDVTVAVQVGLILACLFFIYRMSQLTTVEPLILPAQRAVLPDGRSVAAWRVFGTLFFGSVTKIENLFDSKAKPPDVVVLDLHQVISMDNSGLDALEHLHEFLARHHSRLILVAPNDQPLSMLHRSGFLAHGDSVALYLSMEDALASLD
jgi:sulfate permease, SulP family